MTARDYYFWLGDEAEAAACELVIDNQFWTAAFVPEIDLTDGQADE